MGISDLSNKLFTLFGAMEKRYHPDKQTGILNASEAVNAFNIIKNEQPDLINVLPEDVKKKFAQGLTGDMFNSMDPLGVADGLINREEFTKFLNPDDKEINMGNHGRGDDPNNVTYIESYDRAGYSSPGANGKRNALTAGNNIITDFEGAVQDGPGKIDKRIDKSELQRLVATWGNAGQNEKKKVAQALLDNYDAYKGSDGMISPESFADAKRKAAPNMWE